MSISKAFRVLVLVLAAALVPATALAGTTNGTAPAKTSQQAKATGRAHLVKKLKKANKGFKATKVDRASKGHKAASADKASARKVTKVKGKNKSARPKLHAPGQKH